MLFRQTKYFDLREKFVFVGPRDPGDRRIPPPAGPADGRSGDRIPLARQRRPPDSPSKAHHLRQALAGDHLAEPGGTRRIAEVREQARLAVAGRVAQASGHDKAGAAAIQERIVRQLSQRLAG